MSTPFDAEMQKWADRLDLDDLEHVAGFCVRGVIGHKITGTQVLALIYRLRRAESALAIQQVRFTAGPRCADCGHSKREHFAGEHLNIDDRGLRNRIYCKPDVMTFDEARRWHEGREPCRCRGYVACEHPAFAYEGGGVKHCKTCGEPRAITSVAEMTP